jgi:hypothetical protein
MLRLFGLVAFACFLAGCSDSSNTLSTIATVTLVTADPLKFRGALQCGSRGLETYVVALFDTSQPSAPVGVSSPTACTNPTSFGQLPVVPGDHYVGAIDGYDRADIMPAAVSSRQMLDLSGNPVSPRFTTTCGEFPTTGDASTGASDASEGGAGTPPSGNPLRAPTQALLATEVFLQGCLPLSESSSADASTPNTDGGADAADESPPSDSNAAFLEGGPSEAETQPPDAADAPPVDASDAPQNGG